MNYKHLGKYHYIYEVIANEHEIRIERHPIVYSNKDYIYFVRSGATEAVILDTPDVPMEVNYDEMMTWIRYAIDTNAWYADREYYILDEKGATKLKELVKRLNSEGLLELHRQQMLEQLNNRVARLKCNIETYERELAKTNEKIKELGGDA